MPLHYRERSGTSLASSIASVLFGGGGGGTYGYWQQMKTTYTAVSAISAFCPTFRALLAQHRHPVDYIVHVCVWGGGGGGAVECATYVC